MLVREVFGWLRFCLQHDALCCANRIAVEEIPAIYQGVTDVNDGPRTLAIYSLNKGYSPRIEIRFTGERPQVWFMPKDNSEGEYLLSPTSSKFPGDFRSWKRTEFVQYLIDLAKARLCADVQSLITVIPVVEGSIKVEAGPKVDLDNVIRIINAAKKPNTLTQMDVKNFLKNQVGMTSGDPVMDFAHSVIYYFKTKKLKWEDIDVLENEDNKGKNIIPWSFFKAQLSDPIIFDMLPPPVADRVSASSYLEDTVKKIVEARNQGLNPLEELNPLIDLLELGTALEAAFLANSLPLPYLNLLEKADRKERIAPWSMIRRNVLANEGCKPCSKEAIEDKILAWLDSANLYAALYGTEQSGVELVTVRDIIKKRISSFAELTIANPLWVKATFDSIVGQPDVPKKLALQAEFDMWMLHALSPSNSGSILPLSPHAYSLCKSDSDMYNEVFGAWLGTIKDAKERRRDVSLRLIGTALVSFYKQITDMEPDSLAKYLPKTPSFNEITTAVKASDKNRLLNLLLADVEDELGVQIPQDVRDRLANGEYFHLLFSEMRFQAINL